MAKKMYTDKTISFINTTWAQLLKDNIGATRQEVVELLLEAMNKEYKIN